MQLLGDFLQGGISAQLGQQTLVNRPVVFQCRAHLLPHTTGVGLQGDCPGQVEANPAVTVRRVFAMGIGADGLPKAQASLLNQVQQQHPVARIFLGQLNHPGQAQIGELFPYRLVAPAAAFRQNRLIPTDRDGSNLLQIQPKGVIFVKILSPDSLLGQLHFPAQTLGGFSHATGAG